MRLTYWYRSPLLTSILFKLKKSNSPFNLSGFFITLSLYVLLFTPITMIGTVLTALIIAIMPDPPNTMTAIKPWPISLTPPSQ